MNTEQCLAMAEALAEEEILFLQEEKYDHALKFAKKRKEIFSRLEKEDLSPVTGIKEKLYRLQAIQGTLAQEARRLHSVLRNELATIQHERGQLPGYHNAVITPFQGTLSTRA